MAAHRPRTGRAPDPTSTPTPQRLGSTGSPAPVRLPVSPRAEAGQEPHVVRPGPGRDERTTTGARPRCVPARGRRPERAGPVRTAGRDTAGRGAARHGAARHGAAGHGAAGLGTAGAHRAVAPSAASRPGRTRSPTSPLRTSDAELGTTARGTGPASPRPMSRAPLRGAVPAPPSGSQRSRNPVGSGRTRPAARPRRPGSSPWPGAELAPAAPNGPDCRASFSSCQTRPDATPSDRALLPQIPWYTNGSAIDEEKYVGSDCPLHKRPLD